MMRLRVDGPDHSFPVEKRPRLPCQNPSQPDFHLPNLARHFDKRYLAEIVSEFPISTPQNFNYLRMLGIEMKNFWIHLWSTNPAIDPFFFHFSQTQILNPIYLTSCFTFYGDQNFSNSMTIDFFTSAKRT